MKQEVDEAVEWEARATSHSPSMVAEPTPNETSPPTEIALPSAEDAPNIESEVDGDESEVDGDAGDADVDADDDDDDVDVGGERFEPAQGWVETPRSVPSPHPGI